MITTIGLIVLAVIVMLIAYNVDKQTKRINTLQQTNIYNNERLLKMFKKVNPAKFEIGDAVSCSTYVYGIRKFDGFITDILLTDDFYYKYEILTKNSGKSYVLECDIIAKNTVQENDTLNNKGDSFMECLEQIELNKAIEDAIKQLEKEIEKSQEKTKKATPKKNTKKSKK